MSIKATHYRRQCFRNVVAILLLLLFFISCRGEDERIRTKPNIILISLDTLRADYLHCYGNDKNITPEIDRIAAKGVLFESVYAQSNWTLPSHVSMLSALYPSRHGVNDSNVLIPDGVTLLPQILKEHGYSTASFNAAGFVSHRFGFDRGFDIWKEIPKRSGDIRDIVDETTAWIQKHLDEKFFVFFHTYEVHHPYDPPERFRKQNRGRDAFVEERMNAFFSTVMSGKDLTPGDFGFFWLLMQSRHRSYLTGKCKAFCSAYQKSTDPDVDCDAFVETVRKLAARAFDEEEKIFAWYRSMKKAPSSDRFSEIDYMMSNYEAEVIYTDQEIGRLLKLLEGMELKNDTLIVITSDHGEEFVEHGRWGHRRKNHHYDETVRVPLIFYYPGRLPENRRISTPAGLIDIVPTILDLAGIPEQDQFDGISLVPLINGGNDEARLIFCESRFDKHDIWTVTVIKDRWKYHHDLKANLPDELYNIALDPGETSNLAGTGHDVMAPLKAAAAQYEADISMQKQEEVALDDQLQEQLKDLGYFE